MNKGMVRLGVVYGVLGLCLIPLAKDLSTSPHRDQLQEVQAEVVNNQLATDLFWYFDGLDPGEQDFICELFQTDPEQLWNDVLLNGYDDDDFNRRTFDKQYTGLCAMRA